MKYKLRSFEQNVFLFNDAFNAPTTSAPGQSFEIRIYNEDRTELLIESTTGTQLAMLKPNELQSATISQTANSGSGVVGQVT